MDNGQLIGTTLTAADLRRAIDVMTDMAKTDDRMGLTLIVDDDQVDAYRERYGKWAVIIPRSQSYLP